MMKPAMPTVGAHIRDLRKASELTLRDMAARTGLSKGYLSELENGVQQNPTLDVLHRVACALQTSIADLLGETPVRARLVTPDELPRALQEFIQDRVTAKELEPETVQWLAHASFRGKRPKTKSDFLYLLRALRESTIEDDLAG